MVKTLITAVLIVVVLFVFTVLMMFFVDLSRGDIRTGRYYYKKFLSVLEQRNLYKYTFPKMSYEQIVSFLEIPEAKVEGCLMDSAMSTYANEDDDGVLVLFVRKESYLNPVTMWINNRREREKEGIILFVPKSYRDYKKLYNYFYNKGKRQKEDELTNAQLKSLQYLKEQIRKAQDNSKETLENCQKENTDITERIQSKNKRNEYLNFVLDSDTTTEKDILNAINLCMKTGNYLDSDEFGKLNAKLVKMGYNKIIKEEIENPMKFVKTKPLPTKTENGVL